MFFLQTTNRHKIDEYDALLYYYNFRSYKNSRKVKESALTYKANAKLKLKAMREEILKSKRPDIIEEIVATLEFPNSNDRIFLFADDSGIEIEALNWKPGIRSNRFKKNLSQKERNEFIVSKCIKKNLFRARFFCSIAFCQCFSEAGKISFSRINLLQSRVSGSIVKSPDLISNKEDAFGYDPIFIPSKKTLTYADLDSTEKNQISHRALAVQKMLKKIAISFPRT